MNDHGIPTRLPAVPDGVPLEAWLAIGATPDGDGWKIPERDADGAIVGWSRRFANGSKGFVKGGHRGLTFVIPFPAYAGASAADPVFVVEGQSDTAAGTSAGLCVVGRPGATGGGDLLEQLLKDRHVVFIGENDGKDGNFGPGTRGAGSLAKRLARGCASVRVIHPPSHAKDLREWIVAGGRREQILAEARASACVAPEADGFISNSIHPSKGGVTESNFSVVSLADLAPAGNPEWLWKGYIARGAVTLLTGLWKAGKSTLVGYILRDLYRGGGLVESATEAPTLVVSEEPEDVWSRRRDELKLSDRIHLLRRSTFAKPDAATWNTMIQLIQNEIEERGICLVVFDTLASLWPLDDENKAGEMMSVLTPLRDLTEAGAAVLLMHHPRKGDGSQGTATRGSGALPSFADVIVEFRRYAPDDTGDCKRRLTAYGRFGEATPPELVIELGKDGYTTLGDQRAAHICDVEDLLAGILPSDGPGMTAEEIYRQWPDGTARPGLSKLRKILDKGATDGRWNRSGEGHKGDPKRFRTSDSIPSSDYLGTNSNGIPASSPRT